jgi:hypothetical protein
MMVVLIPQTHEEKWLFWPPGELVFALTGIGQNDHGIVRSSMQIQMVEHVE